MPGTLDVGGVTTLSDNTTIDGTLAVRNGVIFKDLTGTNTGLNVSTAGPAGTNGTIETNGTLYLGQLTAGTSANSYFTPSAAGNYSDVLILGGTLIVTGPTATAKLTLPVSGLAPTSGTGSIAVGTASVVINTSAVTALSIILITRMGGATSGPGKGTAQESIQVPSALIVPYNSFEVLLVDSVTGTNIAASIVAAEFSWVLIN